MTRSNNGTGILFLVMLIIVLFSNAMTSSILSCFVFQAPFSDSSSKDLDHVISNDHNRVCLSFEWLTGCDEQLDTLQTRHKHYTDNIRVETSLLLFSPSTYETTQRSVVVVLHANSNIRIWFCHLDIIRYICESFRNINLIDTGVIVLTLESYCIYSYKVVVLFFRYLQTHSLVNLNNSSIFIKQNYCKLKTIYWQYIFIFSTFTRKHLYL